MKKYLIVLLAFLALSACNRQQEMALKSADKDYILKVANENFENKKWANALVLYERLSNLVAGTDDAPNVVYNSAYANYYDKNYKLAGHQFKNFSVTFPQDPRAEDAAYMSALCYYEGSMDYNLDQSSTELAINELQNFLNNYPNSEKSKNINTLIDELTYKLEFKAYENARQYYKMADYKAANVAFENVLSDFPATKLSPKIYEYILRSRYELAVNSVYDLKKDRIESALAFTRQVEREMPDTANAKLAADLRNKLNTEKANFLELEKKVEERKKELLEKQREEEARQNAERDQREAEKKSNQARRDSAAAATPAPAATFNIQK
ncbi:outer membrane protein assembly factor BamD [Chryseobacterium sp. 6424]|uniref:outer membrane protein assembly factor BamD n=1 Tax=Chryseobacterium sp. 6424 TaxID=2039166 RepID=UPI000EFC5591|nr:outer membrane protein assembly factor BamD [Chryseobacterium sp. 6424]AYO58799.1 outer membrane protein assembly factor BamD [Chryseobacterium sp. 6424]AYO58955.1 outer membrane protein assembly factor BamD [Chryseobacterium sp. 6424]